MNIFEEVNNRVSILETCNLLGIKLNKSNKCLCPFSDHKEKTPSFSVSSSKNIFYCFGCGRKGNCITLVSELLNIRPLEAAKYLNNMLHLGINIGGKEPDFRKVNKYINEREAEKRYEKWENETFQLLCDYYHLLKKWKKEEEPKSIDDEVNDLYIEALHNIDYIGYEINEVFIYGTEEEKREFKKYNGKAVDKWKKRIKESKKY